MKPVRVIKQKRVEDTNEITVGMKKPVEPSMRNLTNTVKGWIAEKEERKRNQRRSLSELGL